MTNADDTILEFFEEHAIALPPAAVAYNIDFSYSHVRNRMRTLADHGLLLKVDEEKGYYGITDQGIAYLAGELEAKELESGS
ncbi:MarR family transcriptional regulator [Haladaptatus sp. DYF46]|uniref:MarR family transcriptional regulator n=1 Tax=Haladaptatus sp. DYF46 TaxID=2886041 RepID=UPI001E58DC61|nr:MarR family transcriptional regulator [Haladaptatus sp. DYF46]